MDGLAGTTKPRRIGADFESFGASPKRLDQNAHAVILDFEGGWGKPKPEDLDAIQQVLERAGVEFIERGVREKDGSTPR